MIVSKFGGSSVKDAEAMRRCAEIVESNPDIRVVILSATYNTTNELERMAKLAEAQDIEAAHSLLQKVKEKHTGIARELGAPESAYQMIEEIMKEGESLLSGIYMLKECSDRALDRLYSIGERVSSALFAGILEARKFAPISFIDARKVIATNSEFRRAKPHIQKIRMQATELILPALEKKAVVVTQGFIGSDEQGVTTTLGREGSDFSAALIAEAIDAKACYIWTDVAGIYTTDPRLISDARKIDTLSYSEATTMARLGAKVLFSETLAPVARKSIPVYVGSSLDAKKVGTWIYPDHDVCDRPTFRALAKSDEHRWIEVHSVEEEPALLFHKVVLDILDRHHVRYESVHLKRSKVLLLLQEKYQLSALCSEELENIGKLEDKGNLSRVSLIGSFFSQENTLGPVWKLIEEYSLPISFSEIEEESLSFYLSSSEAKKLLACLHTLLS